MIVSFSEIEESPKNDIHENSDYIITSNEEGVDIDNLLDLKVAESLINNF